MNDEERAIRIDRMRFIKNSLSANLALLAIVFDVFYFVSIYRSNVGSYYYNILIGASVVYNLVFMLCAFLSSEGVKNYKKHYSYWLLILGVLQVVRIFVIPMRAHAATVTIGDAETIVMGSAQFIKVTVYLLASAACLIAAGVTNYIKCSLLDAHTKDLAAKSV